MDINERQWADIAGVKTEYVRAGSGRKLLYLHPGDGLDIGSAFLEKLSGHFDVHAASHPGFGLSELPDHITTIDDLAHFYLDLIEAWDLQDCIVVGVSFGSWLAMEIATKLSGRIAGMVLGSPFGVKLGSRDRYDILDIFSIPLTEWRSVALQDASIDDREFEQLEEDALRSAVRNREAVTLFAWSPYAHNPKLRHRLHRLKMPVAVYHGDGDEVVPRDYAKQLCDLLPDGTFHAMKDAGHYLHLEKPDEFIAGIAAFSEGLGAASQDKRQTGGRA